MDLWSRKIVGYHAGDTLEAAGAVRAFEMALRELPKGTFPSTIRTGAVSKTDLRKCAVTKTPMLNG
jgi:hypothetical protein